MAHVAEGAVRERLWELVDELFAGCRTCQRRAVDRTIPVVVPEPGGAGHGFPITLGVR